jgi:hypothetical protein
VTPAVISVPTTAVTTTTAPAQSGTAVGGATTGAPAATQTYPLID